MDDNVKFKIRIEKLEKNNRVIIKFEFKNAKLKAKDIKLKNYRQMQNGNIIKVINFSNNSLFNFNSVIKQRLKDKHDEKIDTLLLKELISKVGF